MSTSVTCHLVRSDGSRWIVTEYRRGADGVTVCAVREIEEHAGGGDGQGRAATMWRARLEDGDRLEWRSCEGRVVATSRHGPGTGPGEFPGC